MSDYPQKRQTCERVLVCGGRDYANREQAFKTLDILAINYGISVVIHGAAKGADSLADGWAYARNVPVERFPADWSTGRKAGPLRNQKMLAEGKPTLVVVFPGGRGTADMHARAIKAGIACWVV